MHVVYFASCTPWQILNARPLPYQQGQLKAASELRYIC